MTNKIQNLNCTMWCAHPEVTVVAGASAAILLNHLYNIRDNQTTEGESELLRQSRIYKFDKNEVLEHFKGWLDREKMENLLGVLIRHRFIYTLISDGDWFFKILD